jgi:hypothetical protein
LCISLDYIYVFAVLFFVNIINCKAKLVYKKVDIVYIKF